MAAKEIDINWEQVWKGFERWMCSHGVVLDIRTWNFKNSQEAKYVIEDLVERSVLRKGNFQYK